jgi:DNA-binding response OmpR family regulator
MGNSPGPGSVVRPATARTTAQLLVVEDNPQLADVLRQGLAEQGYDVDLAGAGRDCIRLAAERRYDAIILDLMLPDMDGVTLCRDLRRRGVLSPVLMLTVLSSSGDKVRGLDAGADDYLSKPFEFEELFARVRSLLRRGAASEPTVLRYDDLEMDLLRRQVTRGGARIRLTPREFALLELFLRNPERVLTRALIGSHVWESDLETESNVIDVFMHTLRTKIRRGSGRPLLHTVVGEGYRLSAEEPAH